MPEIKPSKLKKMSQGYSDWVKDPLFPTTTSTTTTIPQQKSDLDSPEEIQKASDRFKAVTKRTPEQIRDFDQKMEEIKRKQLEDDLNYFDAKRSFSEDPQEQKEFNEKYLKTKSMLEGK